MASARKYESKCGKLLVAAIDFGTTFSGYAFSFKSDYESDPANVSINSAWTAGSNALLSLKTPTTLLLNPDKSFKAFGFDAEDMYIDLAAEDMHKDYYFFRHFKMKLFNNCSSTRIERDMEIQDVTGKKMKALTVFGMSIKYLKEHLLRTVKLRGTDIRESDICWVLTVPAGDGFSLLDRLMQTFKAVTAIWTNGTKQFMREAAEVAGITGPNLVLALESEAASLYCMHLPVDKMAGSGNQRANKFETGTKYMVVDAGGDTIDITIFEVVDDYMLKELDSASQSGFGYGGKGVDAAFTRFMVTIFGSDVFHKFYNDHRYEDVVSLYREFEIKKRNIRLEGALKETLCFPAMLIQKYKDMKDRDF